MSKDIYINGKKVIGWYTRSGQKRPYFENVAPLSSYQRKIETHTLTEEDYKKMLEDYNNWYNSLDKNEIKKVLDKLQEHKQKTYSLDINTRYTQESNPLGEYINKKLGYDKLPQLIDKTDYFESKEFRGRKIVMDYDYHNLDENHWFRGINGDKAHQYIQEFKTGKFFSAEGDDLNGTYFTNSYWEASQYTAQSGEIEENIIYAIPKENAKRVKYSMLGRTNSNILGKIDQSKYMNEEGELYLKFTDEVLSDPGYYASLLGYDIVEFNEDCRKVVLNRSALKVVK